MNGYHRGYNAGYAKAKEEATAEIERLIAQNAAGQARFEQVAQTSASRGCFLSEITGSIERWQAEEASDGHDPGTL